MNPTPPVPSSSVIARRTIAVWAPLARAGLIAWLVVTFGFGADAPLKSFRIPAGDAATTPIPVSAAPAATMDEAIVLSPFQVDASLDRGYAASQTLNGTRMKTDLKDIGSALTVFTEQMVDDASSADE